MAVALGGCGEPISPYELVQQVDAMRYKSSAASSARSVAGGLDVTEYGPVSLAKASDGDSLEQYKLRDSDSSSNGSNGWVPEG